MQRFSLSRRVMRRRLLTAAAAWFVVAVAAFGVVVVALGVSGTGLFGSADQPISEAQAADLLARQPTTTPPQPTTTPSPGAGATLVTAAGTLRVTCVAGLPMLDYVSPVPGYTAATKNVRDPKPGLYVIMSGNSHNTNVAATCPSGRPVFDVQ